jgi:hypothetical protein
MVCLNSYRQANSQKIMNVYFVVVSAVQCDKQFAVFNSYDIKSECA